MARDFRDQFSVRVPLYTDPNRGTFAAAGLRNGIVTIASLRSVAKASAAFRSGFRQGATQGDPWQQGGAVVVRPDGVVPLAHVNEFAGDHVEPADLLRAIQSQR